MRCIFQHTDITVLYNTLLLRLLNLKLEKNNFFKQIEILIVIAYIIKLKKSNYIGYLLLGLLFGSVWVLTNISKNLRLCLVVRSYIPPLPFNGRYRGFPEMVPSATWALRNR